MSRHILSLAQRLLEDWTEGRYADEEAEQLAKALDDAAQEWRAMYTAERR